MSEHSLWVCDKCRHEERVSTGTKPAYWGTATLGKMAHSPHWRLNGDPTSWDLCPSCFYGVDQFLRHRKATVEVPS